MYKIELTSSAKKDFKTFKIKKGGIIIAFAIEELKIDPFVGKSLERELDRKWALRVNGYRIIYLINKKERLIIILKIKTRATVYN